MSDEKPLLEVSLHGPGVRIEDAVEAAEATKKLLAAVAKEMGVSEDALKWQIASIQFQCDGCGLKRADRPRPDEGWTYTDGDDLCPACTKQRAITSHGAQAVAPKDSPTGGLS